MAHSVQPELAICQRGDPCWCHLAHFFTGALSSFPFFLALASPPNTFWFTLRGGGEERPGFPGQPAACAAALCLVPTFALTATEQSLGDPSAPCTPPSTHLGHSQNPHPNSFSLTDFWYWFGVFFLLKMYPYTLHLNTLWNSPCEKQTDVMLCALQVVALLICCFPNNSRFFYFASVFVASCYLLAKTKQASLVSKAFHQLSHQHSASLVSFAFVLCLLHSH